MTLVEKMAKCYELIILAEKLRMESQAVQAEAAKLSAEIEKEKLEKEVKND